MALLFRILNQFFKKRSGAGKVDIDHFDKQLNEYSFLSWLNPFIRLRSNTKTNLPTDNEQLDSSDDKSIDVRDGIDNGDDTYSPPTDEDEYTESIVYNKEEDTEENPIEENNVVNVKKKPSNESQLVKK